ncbi:unnamed protein product [Paramecium sonneborni]|uniref:Uncharacterized protein n=1 Tax=Paramecium sonneborni TaxID=65129 RepID=A0A8S1PPS1_9CILI|nr:unnamed protein product [Paramecium sonneborni]
MAEIKLIGKEDLKCFQKHNFPICSINLGKDVKMNERLLCNECLLNFIQENNIIQGFNIIQSKIENNIQEYRHKQISFIAQKKQQLVSLKNNFIAWKSTINQQIDQILGYINLWIDNIISKNIIKDKYVIMEELENFVNQYEFHEKNFEFLVEQINFINQASSNKIQLKLAQLNEEYRKIITQTKDSFMKIINISQHKISLKPINNQLKQSDDCFTIAFNYTGQIMISGCGKDIKVWNFQNGQIQEVQKLQVHQSTISCLLFSKNQNSFISGAYDHTIRCWLQINGQQWKSSQKYEEHSSDIQCLLLCKKEKTLFSGSCDKSIKIWIVDFANNNLQYCYSLEKHTHIVYGLTLNESETFLVSCGDDQQIIIWKKSNNNKWEFYQLVNQSIREVGAVTSFIKENLFIWIGGVQNGKDCVSYFELIKGCIVEQKNKEQQLILSPEVFNYSLFPIVFNKEKQIILFRHKFHIYLLTKQISGKYRISTKIKFESNEIWGSMTNDAKFLVLWEKKQCRFLIYQIEYQTI